MAYTVDDSPAIVARIESDLAAVRRAVQAADPRLRSLVLTGGFARGEGAMAGGAPQNDYDFVAIRSPGPTRTPYRKVAAGLERTLGLHIDLAPVQAWRLPFVSRSIFWYETARRGRVLWGEDLLDRIRVPRAIDLDPREGLRLLANRAAGLLLVTPSADARAHRIQAAKGLLAALDAHLLARGLFAPSQTERMRFAEPVLRHAPLRRLRGWVEWAYRFKVDPDHAEARDPRRAWRAARRAILDSVPVALHHAGLPDLDADARRDGLADHAVFALRASHVPAPLVLNPTGRVRAGTLRLLEAAADGQVRAVDAEAAFGRLARGTHDPVGRLDALRHATLQ